MTLYRAILAHIIVLPRPARRDDEAHGHARGHNVSPAPCPVADCRCRVALVAALARARSMPTPPACESREVPNVVAPHSLSGIGNLN